MLFLDLVLRRIGKADGLFYLLGNVTFGCCLNLWWQLRRGLGLANDCRPLKSAPATGESAGAASLCWGLLATALRVSGLASAIAAAFALAAALFGCAFAI